MNYLQKLPLDVLNLILEYVRTVSPTMSDSFIQVPASENMPPMNIIDTPGRTFHKIEELAIQDAAPNILFIVFDITSEESFKAVQVRIRIPLYSFIRLWKMY